VVVSRPREDRRRAAPTRLLIQEITPSEFHVAVLMLDDVGLLFHQRIAIELEHEIAAARAGSLSIGPVFPESKPRCWRSTDSLPGQWVVQDRLFQD